MRLPTLIGARHLAQSLAIQTTSCRARNLNQTRYDWLPPLAYMALGSLIMLATLHSWHMPQWQMSKNSLPARLAPQSTPGSVTDAAFAEAPSGPSLPAPPPPPPPSVMLPPPCPASAPPEAPAAAVPTITPATSDTAAAAKGDCQYGWQPGMWRKSPDDPVSKMIEADEGRSLLFEAADPRCALKPLVQHYMALSRMQHNGSEENKRALEWTTEQVGQKVVERIASGPPLTVLFFGDSVDAKLLSFFCWLSSSAAVGDGTKHGGSHCITDRIVVVKYHFFGVHFEGPWFEGEGAPPLGLVDKAMAYFKKITGKDTPDIFNIQSCFWDAGRLWEQDQQWVRNTEVLPAELMRSWAHNLTTVANKLKELSGPKALGFYHTPARVAFRKKAEWWSNSPHLDQHISQFAAAGRGMAAAVGLTTIDFELMALPLQKETYLKDRMHPYGAFLSQMLNLYLNEYFQREMLASV